MLKGIFNREELPVLDVRSYYNDEFNCSCAICRTAPFEDVWDLDTVKTVIYLPIHSSEEERSKGSPYKCDTDDDADSSDIS